MTRTFTCIICPNGCEITAEYEGTDVRSIEGATCPKGQDYVRQELTDPRRNIATSIPVECASCLWSASGWTDPSPRRTSLPSWTPSTSSM